MNAADERQQIARLLMLSALLLTSCSAPAVPESAAQLERPSDVEESLREHCPDAHSEEVITCAREVMAEADERIKRDLCAYRPNTCEDAFLGFTSKRNELAIALESAINERSVVAQIEVVLFALQTTLAFEKAGAFKERHNLEKQLLR